MNLDKAEEFLKSKGVDTEKYVIHDIKGGYNAQIPIALWLTEFAEQQVKNNSVLDDVINGKPPLWLCPNVISIANQLHNKDNGNGELVVKAVQYIENEALEFGYKIGYYNAKMLLKAYCL